MKALILAAGYATRLHPYTRNFPKALLKVEGRPLLDSIVERIAGAGGIESITVVTNSRFHGHFTRWLRERGPAGRGGPSIRVLDNGTRSNEERLGSIGDVRCAVEREGIREDLLVAVSDKLFDFDLGEMVGYYRRRGATVNACFETGDREKIRGRHGCAELDGDGRIVGFQEKPAEPRSSIESIALYIFPAAVLPMFGEYLAGGNADAPGFFLEWLHGRAPVYAWLFERPCTDVGSLEAFWKANRRVVEAGGLETALLLDHHPPVEPARLGEDLSEVLAALERDDRLYLACLYTDAGRVPVYEALLRERSPRFPVAVKSRDDLPDLERPGILRELGSSRSFHVVRLQARPDWAEPRPAPAQPSL